MQDIQTTADSSTASATSTSSKSLASESEPETEPEPEPQWYKQSGRVFGNQKVNYLASLIYVVLVGTPFALFLKYQDNFLSWVKTSPEYVSVWAVIATMAYPTWAWLEMQAFEPWVRQLPEKQRVIERAFFKTNNDLAKSFWSALFGIYATAGILLALKT